MISSTSNARVKNIVQLQKKAKERKRQGLFVVEGRKMIEEILRDAPAAIAELYVTEEYLAQEEQAAALMGISYELVTEHVMNAMTETMEPQGAVAVVRMPKYDKTALLEKENGTWVALEDLRDPGNLGTILRTSEAAGVTGIILSGGSVDIDNPKVIRSTMGAIFFLSELEGLKQGGATLYAAHLAGKQYYDEPAYEGKTVILIGNEAKGLSAEAAKEANCLVKIPMEGKAESLNAAAAASIIMWEMTR